MIELYDFIVKISRGMIIKKTPIGVLYLYDILRFFEFFNFLIIDWVFYIPLFCSALAIAFFFASIFSLGVRLSLALIACFLFSKCFA